MARLAVGPATDGKENLEVAVGELEEVQLLQATVHVVASL